MPIMGAVSEADLIVLRILGMCFVFRQLQGMIQNRVAGHLKR